MQRNLCVLLLVSLVARVGAQCPLGYTGPDDPDEGPCTACASGKYKDTYGSGACTDCPAGKYGGYEGRYSCTFCLNSQGLTAAGSPTAENCTCNAGYFYGSNYCESCSYGTYKDTIGNAPCTTCPLSSYTEDFLSCVSCPSDSTCVAPCYDLGSCFCNTGYYGQVWNGDTCTSCPPNSGINCVGEYLCEVLDHCFCNDGYYGSFGSCTACPVNSGSNCVDQRPMFECNNREGCACNAGYTGPNGGPCEACVAGLYKSETGSDACTVCPAGTYSGTAAVTCTSVPVAFCQNNISDLQYCSVLTGLATSGSRADFEDFEDKWINLYKMEDTYTENIKRGLTQNTTRCRSIFEMFYCPSLARYHPVTLVCDSTGAPLLPCSEMCGEIFSCVTSNFTLTQYDEALSQCLLSAAQNGSQCFGTAGVLGTTTAALTSCDAGYTVSGGVCSACPAGTWKNTTGLAACESCGARTYSTSIGASDESVCVPCPPNTGASCVGCGDASACTCDPGYAFWY